MRVARHFQIARVDKNLRPLLGAGDFRVIELHGAPTTVQELDKAITQVVRRNRASSAGVQARYRSPAAAKNFSP
jgi:hypothetical protein